MEQFLSLNPVTQAFLATLFTWGLTAAGAALVFFTRSVDQKLMDSLLGFAAGAHELGLHLGMKADNVQHAVAGGEETRDRAAERESDVGELNVSKKLSGQDGRLYLIEVSVAEQPDGRLRI